jgi:hypothetical protein
MHMKVCTGIERLDEMLLQVARISVTAQEVLSQLCPLTLEASGIITDALSGKESEFRRPSHRASSASRSVRIPCDLF